MRSIRAIIPFAAGSFTDILPRLVFDQASSQLKQAIVVENRGGAGGTIGTRRQSGPAGTTINRFLTSQTLAS